MSFPTVRQTSRRMLAVVRLSEQTMRKVSCVLKRVGVTTYPR